MNLIRAQLATLPKKNKTHKWYMRQIQVERDDAVVWNREEARELVLDTNDYSKPREWRVITWIRNAYP